MRAREEFDWTPIYIIGTGLIILFLIILVFQGKISPDGFVVGTGTFLLALATFHLAYTERAESARERRRLRLKEQLEGLYSPLRAEEENILHVKTYGYQLIYEKLRFIFDQYLHKIEFLASDNLKKEMNRLYDEDLKDEDLVLSQDRWNEYIDNLVIIIKDDIKSLLEGYNKLTE